MMLMPTTMIETLPTVPVTSASIKRKRIESIDLLRGIVMIIMTLDHVRDYFHGPAFEYSPTDLAHTSVPLFFTRFITHYCAPVFVLLAGMSAYLYGTKRSRNELRMFLITRGVWLVLIELFIVSLFRTFDPTYTFINLQVIWAIGISMIVLSCFIHWPPRRILFTGIFLIFFHNLLDPIHVPGHGMSSFLWSLLHDPQRFDYGHFLVRVHYPVLPWIGIMLTGYYFGSLYATAYDPVIRKQVLLFVGANAIVFFLVLRAVNFYGDAAHWSIQKNGVFTVLSFLNVSKYPPSLLYTLITLGPAFIFLAVVNESGRSWIFRHSSTKGVARFILCFGRAPMFFYLAHILLIHILAMIAAAVSGFHAKDMILYTAVNSAPALKGYGFNLIIVYAVWVLVIILLYPLCKWFDRYKTKHVAHQPWLSYF